MKNINKNGFMMVETIVMIVFLAISLLYVYRSFSSALSMEKTKIHYDNTSYIYRTFFTGEYLTASGVNIASTTLIPSSGYLEVTCSSSFLTNKEFCDMLKTEYNINKMYIVYNNARSITTTNLDPTTIKYLRTIKKNDAAGYRLVIMFNNEEYASLQLK